MPYRKVTDAKAEEIWKRHCITPENCPMRTTTDILREYAEYGISNLRVVDDTPGVPEQYRSKTRIRKGNVDRRHARPIHTGPSGKLLL